MRTFSKTNLSGTRVSYHGATGIINNATQIDIASLRAASSIKSGLQNLLASNVANTTVTSNGVRISAPSNYPGTSGNNLSVATAQGSTLAHYNIDFGQYLSSNSDMTFPDDLYGKGFRVYCAFDSEQWFNFTFTGNVIEGQDDKPILDNVPDVKNIFVDISEAKDAASFVQAIRDSAEPQLDAINHYIHVEANPA
ncbi:MAG: hypothetical protein IKN43_00745 [Selenomonadaceae bacterium]|nr:hypothetical protein [Selenomonadaceae bacterium]